MRPALGLVLACVFATILSLCAPSSSAQTTPSPMQDAASQIADSLSQAKASKAIVFDFSGPDKKMTQLGQDFAATFRAALAKSSPNLRVEDPDAVNHGLEKLSYAPEIALYPEALLAAAQDLRASSFVMGKMAISGEKLSAEIIAYRCKDGKALRSIELSWTLTDSMKTLVEQKLNYPGTAVAGASAVNSSNKGITIPRCIYCPRADYSSEAMNQKIEGVTELLVVVETDGTVDHIRVVRPLPFGLTAKAIEAVRRWKLAPALGPDGKPTPVRQLIEVSFQLH